MSSRRNKYEMANKSTDRINGIHQNKNKKKSSLTSILNCASGRDDVDSDILPNGEYGDTNGHYYHKGSKSKHRYTETDVPANSLYPRYAPTVGDGNSHTSSEASHLSWNSALRDQPDATTESLSLKFVNRDRRKRLEDIVNAPCIDTYEPPHQLGPDYMVPSDEPWTASVCDAVKLKITDQGPASAAPMSVVTLLKEKFKVHPSKPALSVKREGKWLRWTYADYHADVCLAAKAFIKLGLERFRGVGILGFNAPEWFLAKLGAIFAGGVSVGVYTTNSPDACHYVLEDSEANIVVVENDLQLRKILEVRDKLPHLKAIVQYLGTPEVADVLSWSELMEIGRSVPDEILERRIKSLAVNQCCNIIYTSGTTGNPKGVMLSHDNLTFMPTVIVDHWFRVRQDTLVSYLPLSHIAAQMADVYTFMTLGGEITFAQPDAMKGTLANTLQEVGPLGFMGVPRVYEKMYEKIREAETNMGFLKRSLINWARRCGYTHATSVLNGGEPVMPYGFGLASRVLSKIHSAMGLQNCTGYCSGAAPIALETLEFFLSLNIIIQECYGMSESAGPHILNTQRNFRIGSVGRNSDYNQTKLDKPNDEGHGEICMRGRNVFMGYLGEEEKTMETIDADGFLHSGDIGCYDPNGFLFITGRIKDLIITAGGENVAPLPIESAIKEELPVVSQAVLVGDKRKFLSLLITVKTEIDLETLIPMHELRARSLEWCRSVGSHAKTVQDLLNGADKKVDTAIQAGIDRVNAKAVSNAQRIQKWTILPKDFSLHSGELGPTLKMKRNVIYKKQKEVIDAIYASC